jgi:hypothetical protein
MPMNQLPNITNSHGIAGLRWLLDQAKSWHLSNVELATLLDITTTTLHHWSFEIQAPNNQNFELPASVVERLGLFLGLHKALVLLTPAGHEKMVAEWFTKPIHLWRLKGTSIRAHLLDNPNTETLIELMHDIRSVTT